MNGRWRWVAFIAVVLLAAGAGSAYVVVSAHDRHRSGGRSAPGPSAVRTLPLSELSSSTALPAPADVRRALSPLVGAAALGGRLSGEVVDELTGQLLWSRRATTPLPPASTVKLLTAVAALEVLGPQSTLTTGVVRDGDTLFLVGGGDVTLGSQARPGYPPTASIDGLARSTALALGGARRVRLCIDATAWTGPASAPGWSPGYFNDGDIAPLSALEVDEGAVQPGRRARVADPAGQAAAVFARDLRRNGVTVAGATCHGAAPASGLGLASVASAPVAALVQRMLTQSDNDLAEALGRAVAAHNGGPRDFAGAAAAVLAALRSTGLDVSATTLVDTSGLSRLDRVSPATLVQVLSLAMSDQHPELRPVIEGLPVAGFTGTLADRYRRAPAASGAGTARAKTGTLLGVNTIAGDVVDGHGRLLVFAFMTDRAVSPDTAEPALDRLVGRLATL